MHRPIYNMLGLAKRAGFIVSGSDMVLAAIRRRRAHLVIVSQDAADNTKKCFRDKCAYYQVPYYEFGDKWTLGKSIAKQMRVSLALTDAGFAQALVKKLDETTKGGNNGESEST